jgi:hypothetical protein
MVSCAPFEVEGMFMQFLKDLPPGTIWPHLIEGIQDRVLQEIKEYARCRRADVARGAETAELSALLISKYAMGMARTLDIVGIDSALLKEADRLASEVDPEFLKHQQERWSARPAGVDKPNPQPVAG